MQDIQPKAKLTYLTVIAEVCLPKTEPKNVVAIEPRADITPRSVTTRRSLGIATPAQ